MSRKTYDSHVDFYQSAYGLAVREVKPAGRTGARMLLVEQTPGDWSDAPSPDLVIAVHIRHHVDLTLDIGGGLVRQSLPPGSFATIPPHFATTFLVDTPHDTRALTLPYGALQELAGPDSPLPNDGDFGLLHCGLMRDKTITDTIRQLWAGEVGGVSNRLWADGAILQIAARLLTLRSGSAGLAPVENSRLPDARVRRAAEVLRSDLHRDIGLAEVATATGMSPFHFARQFRAMFGMSPIQYRIAARIETAQVFLRTTRLPVAEIAYRVGYTDKSRFSQHFKARTGATPAAWRAG